MPARKQPKAKSHRLLTAASIAGLFLIVVALMFLLNDRKLLIGAIERITLPEALLFVSLTGVSLVIRAFRWSFLLKAEGMDISAAKSAKPLTIGLAASLLTPAKAGDFARCVFLQKSTGISAKKTVSSVLFERMFDVIPLLLFSATLVLSINSNRLMAEIAIALAAFLAISIAAVFWFPPARDLVFKTLLKGKLSEMTDSARKAPRSAFFYAAALMTIPIWLVEFGRMYLILLLVGATGIGFLTATGIFATSILAGVMSAIPGGFGTSELSAVALFALFGVPPSLTSAELIVDRLTGFWPVVALGTLLAAGSFGRKPPPRRLSRTPVHSDGGNRRRGMNYRQS